MSEEELRETLDKEKKIFHNKLQLENDEYKIKINEYNTQVNSLNNKNALLVKENDSFKELIEKQKNEHLNLNNKYEILEQNFNKLVISNENDKNTHTNICSTMTSQLGTLKNENVLKDINYQKLVKEHKDLNEKDIDLKNRYQSLTQVYSKQIYENDVLKKELEFIKNECKISSDNNKLLHDELMLLKKNIFVKNNNILVKNNNINTPCPPVTGNITSPNTRGIKLSTRGYRNN